MGLAVGQQLGILALLPQRHDLVVMHLCKYFFPREDGKVPFVYNLERRAFLGGQSDGRLPICSLVSGHLFQCQTAKTLLTKDFYWERKRLRYSQAS